MIITQTPLRISLAGGGTDFADYYRKPASVERQGGGCVVSTAIDKYIYVIVKERFDSKIRIGYSRTEMVDRVSDVEHELAREALRRTGIASGIEIATMADIPSEGSGLGSSSSVTVGLLHALYAYRGELVTPERLAREACEIEIDVLGKPIGKQDQYIAAYGGVRRIAFREDDSVVVEPLDLTDSQRRRIGECLMLFYTGIARKADAILEQQRRNIDGRVADLDRMRAQAGEVWDVLSSGDAGRLGRLGRILHEGWALKRGLADKISTDAISALYDRALEVGATGGKIAGAGGGGFLLLFCPPDRQSAVRHALSDQEGLRELEFALERDGTKVIFNARR